MSDRDFVQSPADPLPDRLKQYLSDTARREIEALRAELDSRLLALEAALAHPDPHESLETLVIELARVATTEAEASVARATHRSAAPRSAARRKSRWQKSLSAKVSLRGSMTCGSGPQPRNWNASW